MRPPSIPIKRGEWTPIALSLISQTYTCKCCGRSSHVASAEPMLQLQHKTLNRRRHIRRDDWARAVHTPLPRQIIEATATIEQCEICFLAHDPRQPDLFPTTAAVVPRQFCGDPRLSGEEDETPTSSKPTVTFTLQDLLK